MFKSKCSAILDNSPRCRPISRHIVWSGLKKSKKEPIFSIHFIFVKIEINDEGYSNHNICFQMVLLFSVNFKLDHDLGAAQWPSLACGRLSRLELFNDYKITAVYG